MNSKKEWMKCISYGAVGIFSFFMFVFGVMFPEYTFVRECYATVDENGAIEVEHVRSEIEAEREMERLQELLREKGTGLSMENSKKEEDEIKITCLSYEYLKEIINGWY